MPSALRAAQETLHLCGTSLPGQLGFTCSSRKAGGCTPRPSLKRRRELHRGWLPLLQELFSPAPLPSLYPASLLSVTSPPVLLPPCKRTPLPHFGGSPCFSTPLPSWQRGAKLPALSCRQLAGRGLPHIWPLHARRLPPPRGCSRTSPLPPTKGISALPSWLGGWRAAGTDVQQPHQEVPSPAEPQAQKATVAHRSRELPAGPPAQRRAG